MRKTFLLASLVALSGVVGIAQADIFENYDSLSEGFLGTEFTTNGITYRDVNSYAGVYADGTPFAAGEPGTQLVIENAGLFYDDFPDYGSPDNSMTFGSSFVPGENLTIGALSSVYMDIPTLGDSASLDIAFYENGPWGNIEYHLDGLMNGQVVSSDSFTIADGGGRDNPTWSTLSVSGATFDSLHLYAYLNGVYTAPRGMIDNLTVTAAPVPEPASLAALGLGALALIRRRRKSK